VMRVEVPYESNKLVPCLRRQSFAVVFMNICYTSQ